MPRPLRINYEKEHYQVMNRGAGRKRIFHGDAYYQAFLQSVGEAVIRLGLCMHAYCLMGNQYHLVVSTPRGSLDCCMRHISGVYTQRHNRLRYSDDPLFRGRYKAILVEADNYLLPLTRYVHRNPIEMRTPLVLDLKDYPWSSYPAYVGMAEVPRRLYRDSVFGALGSTSLAQRYHCYLNAGTDDELRAFFGRSHLKPVLGSEAFVEKIVADKVDAAGRFTLKRQQERLATSSEIVSAVADCWKVSPALIISTPRGCGKRNVARWVAMSLCREVGGHDLGSIAAHFGIRHISGSWCQRTVLRSKT